MSYFTDTLTVSDSTDSILTAQTVYGAMRGLETFSQLIFHLPDGEVCAILCTLLYYSKLVCY